MPDLLYFLTTFRLSIAIETTCNGAFHNPGSGYGTTLHFICKEFWKTLKQENINHTSEVNWYYGLIRSDLT